MTRKPQPAFELSQGHGMVPLLFLLAFLSMLPNIRYFELTLEEPRRAIIAYEMWFAGNLHQPTLFGEPYLSKPPLFNWLAILASHIFGWGELTVRSLSLTFTILTALLTYVAARAIFTDPTLGRLSALAYVTCADILFHYGWIGEIDATVAFFVLGIIVCQWRAYATHNAGYVILSGLLTGLTFFLKGFPAYAFFGLTMVSLAVFHRRYLDVLRWPFLTASAASLALPLIWILFTDAPGAYLERLFHESFSRVTGSNRLGEFFLHLATYPLLNVKQFLPLSLVVPFVLWKERPRLRQEVKCLLLILGLNYLPYWLSSGSRGRYIIPLFPLLAMVCASVIQNSQERVKRLSLILLTVFIAGRFIYGLIGFPLMMERRGSVRAIGQEIARKVGEDRSIAFRCWDSTLGYYIDTHTRARVVSERMLREWNYLVSCEGPVEARLVAEFSAHRYKVMLYARR